MTDKKFTDEEIIKTLECHDADEKTCKGCELYPEFKCCYLTKTITLDLINRQKAEIERLETVANKNFNQWNMLAEKTKQHYANLYEEAKDNLKAEAYKEFAKKLKEKMRLDEDCDYNCRECCYECNDYVTAVDNLLKEMVGEKE